MLGLFGRHGTQEEVARTNLIALGMALDAFYKQRHRARPGETLTCVHDLSKCVGDPSARKLLTKGHETYGVLLFLIDFMQTHLARLDETGPKLLGACRSLARIVEIFNGNGANIPPNAIQECFDQLLNCYELTRDVDEMFIPKRHLMLQLLKRMGYLGNPRLYANWYDEALNKVLKAFCRTRSQATFESFLLLRMNDHLKTEAEKRGYGCMFV